MAISLSYLLISNFCHKKSIRKSIIRAKQSTINKTKDLIYNTSNFAKKFGKVMLIVDIIWTTSENILSGQKYWYLCFWV